MRRPSNPLSLLRQVIMPAVGSTLLTLGLLMVLSPQASASDDFDPQEDPPYTFRGCKYDADSIDPIQYRFFSVGSAYETAFKEAENAWDGTLSPGYFDEHSMSLDPEINVLDEDRIEEDTFAWAFTTGDPDDGPHCADDGTHKGNEVSITFNTTIMDSVSAHKKKMVAIHELGHAYGLGHVITECRVMRSSEEIFTCGTLPSDDDVDGVIALYPPGDDD